MELSASKNPSYSFSGRLKNGHISDHITSLLDHFNQHSGQRISVDDIDSVFGFTDRYCPLYGGRSYDAYEPAKIQITDEELRWMYDTGINLKLAVSAPKVSRHEYLSCRSFFDHYYRKGNTLIITNDRFAEWVREDYPDYLIEASVIRDTNNQEAIKTATVIYDYIVIPIILNDDTIFLENIEDKEQIRLFVNTECSYNCLSKICYSVQSNINKKYKRIDKFQCSVGLVPRAHVNAQRDWENWYFDIDSYIAMGFRSFKVLTPKFYSSLVYDPMKLTRPTGSEPPTVES